MLLSSRWLAPPRLVPEEVAQRSCVVRLPNFLTVDDIERLFAATDVVRLDLEQAGRVGLHDLAYRQSSPKQTWTTVFLNHRLAELLPELHERRYLCQKQSLYGRPASVGQVADCPRLAEAWGSLRHELALTGASARPADRGLSRLDLGTGLFAAAQKVDAQEGWDLLGADRHPLSFRVVELHSVQPGGGLQQPTHFDYGSLITLDLMLSEPGVDFEGGRLQTLESDDSVLTHPFDQGDLVLFHSHKYHSVTPVTRGTRRVCVLEIWEGLPRRCPRRCTDPWGPCTCQFAPNPPVYRPREGSEYFVPASVLKLLREASREDPM